MVRAANDLLVFPQSTSVAPRAMSGTRALLGVLLLLIAIAAIVGIVVTASSGQVNAAIIIGIFSAAFFSRVLC